MLKKQIKHDMLLINLGLIVILIILLLNVTTSSSSKAETTILKEDKIYCNATIDDNFEDNIILVVLDENLSKINKKHEYLFEGIEKKYVKDLTYIEGDSNSNEYLDRQNFHQILKIVLAEHSKQNVLNTIKIIERIEGILWAGPNYISRISSTPSAASGNQYPKQWGLHGANGIHAEQAWDKTIGNGTVRVGVMDSGIANHADLNANLSSGWDFINKNSITTDDIIGHGTHVAGIIGATGTNVNGVSGVCQQVQLIPMQITYNKENWKESAAVEALSWAINNNIDIINFSCETNINYPTLKKAIENYQGLFVCAAGNSNSNNDNIPVYAANYSQGQSFSDRVISVGAISDTGNRASYSNYGVKTVSLFAPGENILSTVPGGYGVENGTSMATPFVTGTAALMLSVINENRTNLSPAQTAAIIKSTILDTVKSDGALGNLCVSGGRLDAYAALRRFKNPTQEQIFDNVGYEGSTFSWKGKVDATVSNGNAYYKDSSGMMVFTNDFADLKITLRTVSSNNTFATINGTVTYQLTNQFGAITKIDGNDTFVSTVDVNLVNSVNIGNPSFKVSVGSLLLNGTYTLTMTSVLNRASWTDTRTQTFTFKVERPSSSCVAEGSLITLADGTQKAVEELTGDERLLVWNMFTGKFDSAPILFIDSDPRKEYEVTNLKFSDGTSVKVIDEHGFWDFDQNEYVFLRKDAAKYIGHWFNKQTTDENGNLTYKRVQLIDAEVKTEYTSAWSPVTYGHLCYYVNGMLSMPGATEGLINIFDVDPETMKIDQAAYAADIAKYGLFTYEEFAAQYPVPEVIFEAFGGQYLKVAMGKDLLTAEMLESLIAKYSIFFEA